ncbi:AMP-binding protein [Thiocystis violascens]|uniref:Acyl-CoA synthetase (AMP-forming)/AMP-acid ligase II n=1 Tax=Thiocystis violascens (strain ATCC 17096 / DSM 198 / 6111) TaxID=765911 RepID=I3Y9S7_THIV6|nr:AMP-binding protein [Thiocystis violascens]AFL73745.1 acyl-CoA synthetase (AMP-forming)/AMP-acid ligase II [Thiocystis violascens DSM 198]
MISLSPWWTREHVSRLLTDLIAAEVARLRPGLLGLRNALETSAETAADRVDPDLGRDLETLELDSLEFLDLATVVTVQFHLQETGLDDDLIASHHLGKWVDLILRSRARWDEAISFQTSGSTGRPKLCTHPMPFLTQEVACFADLLRGRRRVLSAVPAHHIYGFLFSVMLPALLDIPVRNVRDTLPGSVLRRACAGDLILGHPAFFDLATRAPVAVADDVVALTSTAPCPDLVWRLLGATGLARVIEIYGASESAGIGVREASDVPFRLLPHWSRVTGSHDRILRLGIAGDTSESELPDHVRWLDDRAFQVAGRRDGAVQIGGINVFPERVQGCLREHPEVADALVRLASAGQGGRLKAFVVPGPACPDSERLPERLQRWLAERLTPAEQPRSITIGSQLPRSALGKPMDWD